ncbi:MAG: DUF4271 domain-containing protein [Bacteroidales bacterium]|nr:DUF4271 domain-containing protein [Bacteroidales bacterium]
MTDSLNSIITTDSCNLDSTPSVRHFVGIDSVQSSQVTSPHSRLDSILLAKDSSNLMRTDAYRAGTEVPDHTYPMRTQPYCLAGDDVMIGVMAFLFFLLAAILYRSRENIVNRLKDLFIGQRTYGENHSSDNMGESIYSLLLTTISALSLTIILLHQDVKQSCLINAMGMPYWLLGAGVLICVGFVYLKAGLYSLVNWTFFNTESNKRWLKDYLLLTALTAFIFYPIALIDIFFPHLSKFVIGGIMLILFLYEILLFYKLIINFRIRNYGYILFFLYFCSVELMPALVLRHLVMCLNYHFLINNILY